MMWMVRSGGGDYVDEFIARKIVSVGWKDAGSLASLKSRDQIIDKVRATWPDDKPMKTVMSGSQLDKLANVMKVGDRVLTFDPSKRIYYVGKITGPYEYRGDVDDMLSNRRPVEWDGQIERDRLSVPTKNSLGSTLTIFTVPPSAEAEIESLLHGTNAPSKPVEIIDGETEVGAEDLLGDVQSRAREFIKDRLAKLDWDEMQQLVAGLLRAMGYKTQISPPGSDRGKDIVASPDALGLEQPRIVVEVKHREGKAIGSQHIRSFLGGRHKDDRGLYVSSGGYSKDAKYEADRAAIPLTLMDLDGLVDLIVDYYEAMDLPTRTLLPLTRVYWPS
jgi:restriction system protein